MRIADVPALLRRRFAMLAMPTKHLASPIVGIACLRRLALRAFVAVWLLNHHDSSDHLMSRSPDFLPLPPYPSTRIPKALAQAIPAIPSVYRYQIQLHP